MRIKFKEILEINAILLNQHAGEHLDTAWKFGEKASERIDASTRAIPDGEGFDVRKMDCLLICRNCVADLCCCLDSLERGHTRTILNNLRMAMEDFALVIMLNTDDDTYNSFKNNVKVSGSRAIGYVKNHEHGHEMFSQIWGQLSEISHHCKRELITRQTISISSEGALQTLLKQINPSDLKHQLTPLMSIAYLFRAIGEYAERICVYLLDSHYYWTKIENGFQQDLNIPLAAAFDRLVEKCSEALEIKTQI